MIHDGFRDILCEIVLAAWKSSLLQAPSASGLCARAVAVVCCQVLLKKAQKTDTALFLLPPRHIRLVKPVSRDIVVETELAVKSESAPEYFGISKVENTVFDRMDMGTDRPSQEGHEDVPNELSVLVSAPESDPTPVVTSSSEGTRLEPTSAMVTRSRAREGRGVCVAPEVQIEPEIETRPAEALRRRA